MKMIYLLSHKICKYINLKASSIFLVINVLFWAVIAFILGISVIFISMGTINGYGLELFCITGYSAVFAGFLGGIIYLYRHEE